MGDTEKTTLSFGCNRGLPDDIETAWGCRAIYHAHPTRLDFVWDRQDSFGPDLDELREKLNGGAIAALVKHIEAEAPSGGDEEIRTFEAEGVKFAYSPQGSHGYIYIAGWLI